MHLPALSFQQVSFFCPFFIELPAMPGQFVQLGCSCAYSDRPEAFFHELTKHLIRDQCIWAILTLVVKVRGCKLADCCEHASYCCWGKSTSSVLLVKQPPGIGQFGGLGMRDPRPRIGIVICPLFPFWCVGQPVWKHSTGGSSIIFTLMARGPSGPAY